MKFLVTEYLSSNNSLNYKPALLSEGISMLELISQGLRKAGHGVYTVIDKAYSSLVSDPDPMEKEGAQDFLLFLEETAEDLGVDYVFPLAPDKELRDIASFCRSRGIATVSSEPEAIGKAADKLETYNILRETGIPQPETYTGDTSHLHHPLVHKSRYGVGCEKMFLMDPGSGAGGDDMIRQEFIYGLHASVSLFANGRESKAISLNEQYIEFLGNGSRYYGGRVPINHPLRDEAFMYAELAVNSIKGLRGPVGVDLVIADKPYVIEINPRLTTSMTALERAAGINIADASLNAFMGDLPNAPKFSKQVEFRVSDSGITFH